MNPLQSSILNSLLPLVGQPNPLPRLEKHIHEIHQQTPLSESLLYDLAHALAVPNLHPRLLYYSFRAVCGDEAVPGSQLVVEWLGNHPQAIGNVLELDLTTCPLTYTDWSVSASEFIPPEQYDDAQGFTERIWKGIHSNGARAAIGGYNHIRPAYGGSLFASSDGARTLHLGLDVFIEPGSPVFAPLDGVVHSVANNTAQFDYGPCVVLEHQPEPELPKFFTLYGHLGLQALKLEPGGVVRKGQCIGQIGNYPENGNWPPHLHLQLILDMLDKQGDFWGSCHPQAAQVWYSLCPDANLLTQVPKSLFPVPPGEKRCGSPTALPIVARGPRGDGYDACGQRVE